MRKNIFGKCFQFSYEKEFEQLVAESIEMYADSESSVVDVQVHIASDMPKIQPSSINPKPHQKFKEGMLTSYANADIYWSWVGPQQLKAVLVMNKKQFGFFKREIIKFLSMEYSREVEIFEQVLHELVFVPAVYFFDDRAPVHAAAVSMGDKAFLLAGTGGVGKSSALLALRHESQIRFISDDVAVISADGKVFPNMAWPKIYGYNCAGSELKEEILAGRGWLDRLHFDIKNKKNPANVRRKMQPNRLFSQVQTDSIDISSLFYVVREDVPDICITELTLNAAVQMTAAVMSAEYAMFHNHLYWEDYNAQATNQSAMLTMREVERNWQAVFKSGFSAIARYKVSIPFAIDHVAYQQRIKDIVTSNYGL